MEVQPMAELEGEEAVLILVKALPQVNQNATETVCCAGVTLEGNWRRQYPVRFRQLGEKTFARWQWIKYRWRAPKSDSRKESRRVQENSIDVLNKMPLSERATFLNRIEVPSTSYAHENGQSLALIRPLASEFYWKRKTTEQVEADKTLYAKAAKQRSFLDEELKAFEPPPYVFHFKHEDADGSHHHKCGDWETASMFLRFRREMRSEAAALQRMGEIFNDEYPRAGMTFALGTLFRYPTWILVGVIRLDDEPQLGLPF